MGKYRLSPAVRVAHIDSKTRHPSWDWNDQWAKIILTDDMIIFRSEVRARLQGGADA